TGEAGMSGRGQVLAQLIERCGLAAFLQRRFELELAIEMILDDTLVAAGDENEMLDAGFARFIDGVLDERSVDDRQHFLGHGLGGRQKSGSEAGNGKYGGSDALWQIAYSLLFNVKLSQRLQNIITSI